MNHYSGFEKAIPAIPSLPGFRTSAGMLALFGFLGDGRVLGCRDWGCDVNHAATSTREIFGYEYELTRNNSILDVAERKPQD